MFVLQISILDDNIQYQQLLYYKFGLFEISSDHLIVTMEALFSFIWMNFHSANLT